MSEVRPIVSAMLLCDLALREDGTRQVSLIRLFDSIRARRFPWARGPFFFVYSLLTDASRISLPSAIVDHYRSCFMTGTHSANSSSKLRR